MGAALGFDEEGLGRLRRVGLLHDIGKLAISNRILDKPGALTAPSSSASRSIRCSRSGCSSG